MDWFSSHSPFLVNENIMSLSTGLIRGDKINCHCAYDIGLSMMTSIIGGNFGNVKFQRKQRVLPIVSINSGVKLGDTVIPINPTLLFQRISYAKKSSKQFEEYFQHELAPYPLSLFDNVGMRKTIKSALYEAFTPITENINLNDTLYVIDGDFLIHRVVWHQQEVYSVVLDKYVEYIKKYYTINAMIVFDGYPDKNTENSKVLNVFVE